MTLYLGVDYAKKFSVATLVNETGEVLKQGKLRNERAEFEGFLSGYSEVKAVLEAGWNWRVWVDLLDGLVEEVQLAHPLKVKAIAEAKIKTDSIDSATLAQLLRADLIPQAYLRSKVSSNRQKILRSRCFYVRMRTKVRNRIHHIIDGQQEQVRQEASTFKDLFTKKARRWLRQLQLSQPDGEILKALLDYEEYLTERITESDIGIGRLFEEDINCQMISSIPGFGKFLSVLTVVEIEQIERFRTADHLSSYAGLVPSTYSSGGKTWHGKIHKQGNSWLRWAFVEAAIHTAACPGQLRYFYLRIKRRKGTKTARVATARKLCAIVFRILKNQKPYQAIMDLRSRPRSVYSAPL